MLSLLFSLLLLPNTSHAKSPFPQFVKSYAEVVKVEVDNAFPVMHGTVTFMQGCDSFDAVVQLSNAVFVDSFPEVKLRVELKSYTLSACLAMPTEQTLTFAVDTMNGPVRVIADSNFGVEPTGDKLYADDLTKIEIQPNTELAKKDIETATVLIDEPKKEITLTLWSKNTCPKGAVCIAGPIPTTYKVPQLTKKAGDCGEVIYTASIDKRSMDGLLIQVDVVDNKMNFCEGSAPGFELAKTSVQLSIKSDMPAFEEYHRVSGDSALEKLK